MGLFHRCARLSATKLTQPRYRQLNSRLYLLILFKSLLLMEGNLKFTRHLKFPQIWHLNDMATVVLHEVVPGFHQQCEVLRQKNYREFP